MGRYVTQQQCLVRRQNQRGLLQSREAFEKRAGQSVLAVESETRTLSAPDQGQELVSSLGVLTENAQHGAGHSLAVHLLDASHNHTHVTGEQKEEKIEVILCITL